RRSGPCGTKNLGQAKAHKPLATHLLFDLCKVLCAVPEQLPQQDRTGLDAAFRPQPARLAFVERPALHEALGRDLPPVYPKPSDLFREHGIGLEPVDLPPAPQALRQLARSSLSHKPQPPPDFGGKCKAFPDAPL